MAERTLNYFDFVRVIAVCLVVIGHVFRIYSTDSVFCEDIVNNCIIDSIMKFIYTFHMPLFCIVSGGVFFLNKRNGHYNNKKKFIENKTRRLLVPYFIFCLLYVLPVMYMVGLVEAPIGRYIIYSYFISSNAKHLWFLLMLFNVFLLYNTFERFIYKHLLTATVMILIINFFSNIFPRMFQWSTAAYYLLYFHIGYILMLLPEGKIGRKWVAILLSGHLLLFLYIILCDVALVLRPVVIRLCSIGGAVGYFYLLKKIWNSFDFRYSHILKILSANSMGIYLFHPMIIYLLFYLLHDKISIIIGIPLFFLISFFLSLFLSNIIQKTRMKFIMGD